MSDTIVIPEEQKGYRCEVIADSISPIGIRIVTMRWKYPLIVHAENCRHRAFSRSVASNRAIPTKKIIAMVRQDPFLPINWGRNQSGMQASAELEGEERDRAVGVWLAARDAALRCCAELADELNVHKQIANRLLNPFQWVTEVVTATDWANYFALRCHKDAQPEVRIIAEMAREAFERSEPRFVGLGEWHLPLIREEEAGLDLETKKRVSAARSARTSYITHQGRISEVAEDLALYERLVGSAPRHASPTEHQATPVMPAGRIGNFWGWLQARYEIPEHTVADR